MPTIETISGNVNLRKQSAQIYAFHAPRKGGEGNEEMMLFAAADHGINGNAVRKIGTPEVFSAVPGTKQEIGGRFFRQKFDLNEGEIFKLRVNARRGYGNPETSAEIFLRVRASAAHRKLRIKMIDHADAAFTHSEIEGTFDILTVEDAEASLKKFTPMNRIYGRPGAVADAITEDIIIQKEQAAPVRMKKEVTVKEDGTEHVTFRKRKRRAVKF